MRAQKDKKKSKMKFFIMLLLIISICAALILGYKIWEDSKKAETEDMQNGQNVDNSDENETLIAGIEEKQVQIFNGTDRPIAVMLDNNSSAWPQEGIQEAYVVYEIIVEGGETRLMALFKDTDTEIIGSVRSARHYFLDYVMEHDAIFAHFGQSPQAESDISKYSIDNISGIAEDGTTFWRISYKYAPHNAVTSIENLLESAEDKNYPIKSNEESVLNYTVDEVELEDGEEAISVTIPHSSMQKVQYIYNPETKLYERYARGEEQLDGETDEVITVKNIIISFADNYTLSGEEESGRQGLDNIGTFDGYYLTNGKVIPITSTKTSRTAQTIYKDLDGNEIEINDGNTFINICPENSKIVFEKSEETNVTSTTSV